MPGKPDPITVEVEIDILDIVLIDWHENTFTLFIRLWSFWRDTRLTINNVTEEDDIDRR